MRNPDEQSQGLASNPLEVSRIDRGASCALKDPPKPRYFFGSAGQTYGFPRKPGLRRQTETCHQVLEGIVDRPERQVRPGPRLRLRRDGADRDPQREIQDVFLGESRWYAIRISGGMRPRLRWIAAYQSAPVSAITHVAEIDRIEPYGDGGKFAVVFKRAAQKLARPIPFGDAPSGFMQGIRYTSYSKLLNAHQVSDIF